ncbi:hypothetical protein VKT23_014049 [Stygiomarasmius scandens]|uniref:Uncharacterized protein n=1 Tax=Marasmiellus scandens TaxID=2682957 RepID=A0ABR1J5G8_9AGAR
MMPSISSYPTFCNNSGRNPSLMTPPGRSGIVLSFDQYSEHFYPDDVLLQVTPDLPQLQVGQDNGPYYEVQLLLWEVAKRLKAIRDANLPMIAPATTEVFSSTDSAMLPQPLSMPSTPSLFFEQGSTPQLLLASNTYCFYPSVPAWRRKDSKNHIATLLGRFIAGVAVAQGGLIMRMPWQLMHNSPPGTVITLESTPRSFRINKPAALSREDVELWLDHLTDRESRGLIPLLFKPQFVSRLE